MDFPDALKQNGTYRHVIELSHVVKSIADRGIVQRYIQHDQLAKQLAECSKQHTRIVTEIDLVCAITPLH